jgi:hypothetical protein
MHQVTVERTHPQCRGHKKLVKHLENCVNRKSTRFWRVKKTVEHPSTQAKDGWVYQFTLHFEKVGGHRDATERQWNAILEKLERICNHARWNKYPWQIVDVKPAVSSIDVETPTVSDDGTINPPPPAVNGVKKVNVPRGVHHAVATDNVCTLTDAKDRSLAQINAMLDDDSEEMLRTAFSGIFDREPQIRVMLSAIKSFLETDGERRNHVLLYGLPACAKTQILLRMTDILGVDAVLRLDATSTTSAGIYKLFFQEYKDDVPPFVVMEEIEKTSEEALRVWLGALDDRGELRKVNYREMLVREVKILCLSTAIDKLLFDRLMGGTEKKPGALSSRFVNKLHCPRPDRKVLSKILKRDIDANGGKDEWIEPALDLAQAVKTDDPRQVLAFLDGGDRLISGLYQKDIVRIYEQSQKEPQ